MIGVLPFVSVAGRTAQPAAAVQSVVGGVDQVAVLEQQAAPPAVEQAPAVQQPAPTEQPVIEPVHPTATSVPPTAEPQPAQPQAGSPLPEDAALQQFAASVTNGQGGQVVGVYVPGILALRIVEQPGGEETYIDSQEGTVTRYALPGLNGVMALLAHNYLSGRDFIKMKPGQEVYLVYGDGLAARYVVSAIEFYQAHSPHDPHSNFTNLNGPGAELLTYQDLYRKMYTTSGTLVFQTCLEANGELSWGRTFVIATPG